MTSLCVSKLRIAGALAFLAAVVGACGVPDYNVPNNTPEAGVIPPVTTGGSNATATGGSSNKTVGAGGGGNSSLSTGGQPNTDPFKCSSNSDCAAFPATKVCFSTVPPGRCVECLDNSTCGAGLYCDATDMTCHVGCSSNAECGVTTGDASPGIPLTCNTTTHQCNGCEADADCKPGTVCDEVTGACVPGCHGNDKNCPANWLCCANICGNPELDATNCGQCGTSCPDNNANPQCLNGVCRIASCKDGYLHCSANVADGCEVNKFTDSANCGACKNACPAGPPAQVCIRGACSPSSCAEAGFQNCNNDPTGACLTNTSADTANCGQCGYVCSQTNGNGSCNARNCIINCSSGFDDCDGKVVNGCETNLNTTPGHCGSCTNACKNDHGDIGCSGGKCAPSCLTGYGDCDGDLTNGCEANESSDPSHCGSCQACRLDYATASCTNGSCTIATCQPNMADCNNKASDGCETNLQTSVTYCGSCNYTCNATHGTATCAAGQCGITCAANFANCDGLVANGCEVDLTLSVDHCGSCTIVCADQPNGTAICTPTGCGVSKCQPPYGDCDGIVANGCESNENSDPNNCSGCGIKCSIPHATAKCTLGACGISTCDAGFADCDGLLANGCEVNLNTDTNNCKACGSVCAPANAVGACVAGTCTITSCKGSFQNCDVSGANAANGCEADTSSSATNCGTCGMTCSSSHGTPSCSAGVCSITCAAGFGNCNGNVGDGCETATTNDAANCGTCGTACVAANATASCLNSACTIPLGACKAGFSDCDTKFSNGCEANLTTDAANCGACSNVCNSTNGTASCTGGLCSISCTAGFGNCDTLVSNGCETNLSTSMQSCGTCGQACAPANATAACSVSNCSITACNTGFANCNALLGDGCEINLTSDPNHCNNCATVCSFANAAAGCNSGVCALGTCTAGYANCDGAAANGCEINLKTDPAHCNSCSTVCAYANASATCSAGACAMGTCSAGFANCDGSATNGCEINLNSDINNCSACGIKCPTTGGTPVCTAGICGYSTCGAGLAHCDGISTHNCETNVYTDINNCGTCLTKCAYTNAAATCNTGICAMGACTSGFGNCDTSPTNGCEVNLKTDANNCNACGNKCTFANATGTCSNGACVMGACNAGFKDCDGLPGNGCEINLNTDINNCNACGTKCSVAGGTPTCTAGSCGIACTSGFGDCDGNPANGCETNLNTPTHCGSCNTVCNGTNGTATCAAGLCGITCNAGFGNCDGSSANGCEINTNTNPNYCGNCSTVCGSINGAASCTGGICGIACTAGYGNCDSNFGNGCESLLASDAAHCGSCATACTYANASGVCSASTCQLGTCNSGFGNCDLIAATGCEVPLSTTTNCGTCGNSCSNAHGTTACTAGSCVPTCSSGYSSCDSNAVNGCEQNTLTDLNHCGNCTTVCSYANATPTCPAGSCVMGACAYLFGNCNGSPPDGCEKSLAADTSNCGGCGAACSTNNATPACSGGACSIVSCSGGYTDCDHSAANGCEIHTASDMNNCGGCGSVCTTSCINGVCQKPCTSYCSSPTQFPGGTYSQPILGVAAFCYETTGAVNGGGCNNFVAPRTLSVNGTAMNCGGWTVPARVNGGYCVYGPAGGHTYDAFNTW